MKNKIYTLLFMVLVWGSNSANAQDIYTFSYSTAAYTPLQNPTILVNTPAGFNGSYLSAPLSFSFQYWQVPYTTFYFNTDGYCSFAQGSYGFYPFYSQLISTGNSQIAYQTTGIAPNRILKIEWKHIGFVASAPSSDSASFQIWLYETSNIVEMHYGPSLINSAHFFSLFGSNVGPQVVFDRPDGSSFYNLQGNASSPTMIYHPLSYLYVTGFPPNGTIYRFTPTSTTGLPETLPNNTDHAVTISPNPVSESFSVTMNDLKNSSQKENATLKVYNVFGALVLNKEALLPNENIDFAGQPCGIYYVQIISGNKPVIKKIIKQ